MKKRVISLLLCLLMALSLIPTAAFASDVAANSAADDVVVFDRGHDNKPDGGKEDGKDDGGNTPKTSVDHIDIQVAVTIGGQPVILTADDLRTAVLNGTLNGVTTRYTPTGYGTSFDNNGNTQIRLNGTFPVGTKTNPVKYTLTLNKVHNGVNYQLSVTIGYWDEANVCPGTYDNYGSSRKESWTSGGVPGNSGIDAAFGTPTASDRQVTVTKIISGVDTDDLFAGKTFTFTFKNKVTNKEEKRTITVGTDDVGKNELNGIFYLPTGTYTVTEAAASYDDYDFKGVSFNPAELVVGDNGGSITVTNTYAKQEQEPETGTLVIKKVLADNAPDAAKNMNFKFKILDKDGNQCGDIITITGAGFSSISVPVGDYTVVELEEDAKINGYNLSTTVSYGTPTSEVSTQANMATVEAGKNTTVTVTNTYEALPLEGKLTITKYISDENDSETRLVYKGDNYVPTVDKPFTAKHDELTYKVKITSMADDSIYQIVDITVPANQNSGKATVDLPYGKYTLEEIVYGSDGNELATVPGYMLNWYTFGPYNKVAWDNDRNCSVVTISEEQSDLNIDCENIYTTYGSLTITKNVEGVNLKADKTYIFKAEGYRDGSDDPWYITYLYVDVDAGETFGTRTFDRLPIGNYRVTEVIKETDDESTYDANIGDFKLITPDAQNVTIKNGETSALTFTNKYTAEIDITKKVERGTGSLAPGKADFTFDAYYTDADGKLVKFDSLNISTNGVNSYTKRWALTIPAAAFCQMGSFAEVTISEVKGNLNGWEYDKTSYKLYVAPNGYIYQGAIPLSLTGGAEVTPVINLTFTNTYSYSYTPGPGPKPNPKPTPKPVTSVKTGDMGIALYAMTSLLSLGGTALVIKKRKDEE